MALTERLQAIQSQSNFANSNLFGIREKIFNVVREEVNKMKTEIMQEMRAILEEKIGEDGVTTLEGRPGFSPIKGVDYLDPQEMAQLKKELKGMPGRKGRDGRTGVDGITRIITKDGSPDTPEQIVDKINTLEERIEQKTIKGLLSQLKTLRRNMAEKAGGGGGDSIRFEDLTSSTNGSLKVFTVPAHITGKTAVFSTQSPHVFRPTIDFTETRTTITLTDAVGAPQTGQSLIVFYVRG